MPENPPEQRPEGQEDELLSLSPLESSEQAPEAEVPSFPSPEAFVSAEVGPDISADKDVWEVEDKIREALADDHEAAAALKAGDYQRYNELNAIYGMGAWDEFVKDHPEKADAYKDTSYDVRYALERKRISEQPLPGEGVARPERPVQRVVKPEDVSTLKTELVNTFSDMAGYMGNALDTWELSDENREGLDIAYKRAQGFVYELTGKDLHKEIKDEARAEAQAHGKKVISRTELLSEANVARVENDFREKRWAVGIKERWGAFTEEEKRQNGGDIKKYADDLEKKRKGLEQIGYPLSKDIFYTLLREGYNPQDAKLKGLFGKKLIIEHLSVDKRTFWEKQKSAEGTATYEKFIEIKSKKEFQQWSQEMQARFDQTIKKEAAAKLEKQNLEGRRQWLRRKMKVAKDIVEEVVASGKIKKEEKVGPVAGAPEKPKKLKKGEKVPESFDYDEEVKKKEVELQRREKAHTDIMEELGRALKIPAADRGNLDKYVELATTGLVGAGVKKVIKRLLTTREKIYKAREAAAEDLKMRRINLEEQQRGKKVEELDAKLKVLEALN